MNSNEISAKGNEVAHSNTHILRNFQKEPWFAIATNSVEGAKMVCEYPWRYLPQFKDFWDQSEFDYLRELQTALKGEMKVKNPLLQSKIDAYSNNWVSKQNGVVIPTLEQIYFLTVRTGTRLARALIPKEVGQGNKYNVTPKTVNEITDEQSLAKYFKLFYPGEHEITVTADTPRDIKFFLQTFEVPDLPTNKLSKDGLRLILNDLTGIVEVASSHLSQWPSYMHKLSNNMGSLARRCKAVTLGEMHDGGKTDPQIVANLLIKHFGDKFTKYPRYSEYSAIPEKAGIENEKHHEAASDSDHNDRNQIDISQLVDDAFQMASATEISGAAPKVGILDTGTSIYMQPLFEEALALARAAAEENDPDLLTILGNSNDGHYTWGAQSSDNTKIKTNVSAIFWAHLQSIATFREMRFRDGKAGAPTVESVKGLYGALGRKTSKESYIKMCVSDTVANLKKLGMEGEKLPLLVTKAGLLLSACLDLQNPFWSKYLRDHAGDSNHKTKMLERQVNSFGKWHRIHLGEMSDTDPRYEGLNEILNEIGVYTSGDMSPRNDGGKWRWRGSKGGGGLDSNSIEEINAQMTRGATAGTVFDSKNSR